MDLSKAFDCVPHNLLLAKLAKYGVNESLLCFIHSLPTISETILAKINNINPDFLNVISGFPQESIFGPILFNCFFNEFFTLLKLQMPEVLQTIIH